MTDYYTKLKDRWPIRKSIDKINEIVGAPSDGWSQDPEIELAKSEYIPELLIVYGGNGMDDDDNFYIMSFLFACFEEAVAEGINIDDHWQEAAELISNNIELHANTLAYWSCYEAEDPNDPEQMFPISQLVREVWDGYREYYL